MSKKVVMTGACGYVGSVTVRELLNKGYKVVAIDNLFKDGRNMATLTENPNFTFIKADVTNKEQMQKIGEQHKDANFVIAGAALVGEPVCKRLSALAWDVNYNGVKNTIEAFPNTASLLLSTGSVYGSIGSDCDENTTPNPISIYGESKLAAENIVLENKGIVYRYSTAGGTSYAQRLNLLINTFVFDAYYNKTLVISQGDFKRSFISVKDMSRSIIHAIENYDLMMNKYDKAIYNIGNKNNNWGKRELASYITKRLGASLFENDELYKDGDARNYHVDTSRMESIGFVCKDNIPDIVEDMIKAIPFFEDKPRID